MANARKDQPANWQWNAGKPRWIPSPTLKAQGWRSTTLKDRHGQYLTMGGAVDQAAAIATAVAGWRAGRLVPHVFAHIAPIGACDRPGVGLTIAVDRLSIGALITAWTGDPAATPPIKPADEFAKLAPATRRDYAGKLKRLVDVLAGYAVLPAKGTSPAGLKAQAAYAADTAIVRAASIYILEPAEDASGVTDLLRTAYWKMVDKIGVHQAHGIMAVASAWLKWCRERQSRTIGNWTEFKRTTPPGRLRVASWPELTALVAAADQLALPGVADAIILAVDLNWPEVDILNLTWDRVKDGRALTGQHGRQKTGRVGGTPFLSIGLQRLDLIRQRQAQMKVTPTTVIHLPRQRRYARHKPGTLSAANPHQGDGDYLRKLFAKVRAQAAQGCPSVKDLTFADLRDTAFTLGREAGLTDDMTASRTLQSRKNIQQLGDRHYGEISSEIADQGRERLEAHIKAKGLKL